MQKRSPQAAGPERAPTEILHRSLAVPRRPARGWLRAMREQKGLSHAAVAEKLGTTRQAYAQLELAEEDGTISMNSLRRAAKAMHCELSYFLRQRTRSPAPPALSPKPAGIAADPAATAPSTFTDSASPDDLPAHMK